MWVRKEIDIASRDHFLGLLGCFRRGELDRLSQPRLPDRYMACLSVRSGFDLLMSEVAWPAGSEVLMTAITIGDMPRIVRQHGYRPIPVDITPESLAPSVEEICSKISPRTRALVVTHLSGGALDLAAITAVCRSRNVMLIDDRAQAFTGVESMVRASRDTDVSMWSFGPVKTQTALGGGLIAVREERLRRRMLARVARYPQQKRIAYANRIMKYAMIRVACLPRIAGAIAGAFRLMGTDHDQFAAELARGFAGEQFFQRIRHRPSTPLLRLLGHRLDRFDRRQLDCRRESCARLTEMLDGMLPILGSQMNDSTHWLFAILVDSPAQLVNALWREGFDATNRSSLRRVACEDSEQSLIADKILQHMVMLPVTGSMPAAEIQRMVDVIRRVNPRPPRWLKEADVVAPLPAEQTPVGVVEEVASL